jgi:hypothetical protein
MYIFLSSSGLEKWCILIIRDTLYFLKHTFFYAVKHPLTIYRINEVQKQIKISFFIFEKHFSMCYYIYRIGISRKKAISDNRLICASEKLQR